MSQTRRNQQRRRHERRATLAKNILLLVILAAVALIFFVGRAVQKREAERRAEEEAAKAAAAAAAQTTPVPTPTEKPPWTRTDAEARFREILAGTGTEDRVVLAVPELLQEPEYPTGCEAIALTAALRGMGLSLEKSTIIEDYLIYHEENAAIGYVGNPTSGMNEDGVGVFPPGLVATAENVFEGEDVEAYAFNTTGKELDELYKFIEAGYPVIVWTTMYQLWPTFAGYGYEGPDGEFYKWYLEEHAVVLCGYDKNIGTLEVSDPMSGRGSIDAGWFSNIFEEIGRYSMVILMEDGIPREAEGAE